MFKKYSDWIAKARDYAVIDDRALLLLGDSAEILGGTSLSADAAIFDPPYDFESSGGKLFGRENSYFDDMKNRGLSDGFDPVILEAASLADSLAVFFHNDQLYEMLGALTKPRKKFLTQDPEEPIYNSLTVMEEPFYPRFALCGWNKSNPMPVANKHYIPDTELYIHAWRPPAFPQGELSEKGRIISAPVGKSEYDHPTVKPQRVMRKVVTNSSKPGDIVLDPFMGSGSTGVAALALGRLFIGIEIDEGFYKIAKERIAGHSGIWLPSEGNQPTLF